MSEQSTVHGPVQAGPDRVALLHALAFNALRLASVQLDGFTTRLHEALAAQMQMPDLQADEVDACRAALARLRAQPALFSKFVAENLQEKLLQAADSTAEHGVAPIESGAMDLSLLSFDAMEARVLLDNLSQVLDAAHQDTLTSLSLRIAHCVGSDAIGIAQNPFRSETFLQAVSAAWLKFHPGDIAHRLVMQQMRPDVFLRLEPVWQTLNRELIARHILPDLEATYRPRVVETDLSAPSLEYRLRAWLAPEGTLNVIASRVVSLLDSMSSHIITNTIIPGRVRTLLLRLQEPLTQLALTDASFLFTDAHPARRLLHEMINTGIGCDEASGAGDPLYQALVRTVEQLDDALDGLTPGCVLPTSAIDTLMRDLQASAAQFYRPLESQLASRCEQALREEEQAHARALAEADVLARIETGEVPGFLEEFLLTQWTRVLAFGHSVRSAKPDVLPSVVKAMDDLIWSVQPKGNPEERKELLVRLPGMLSMLNAWLNVVKWHGPEREQFLSQLAERQTAAMRAPAAPSPRQQLELTMNTVQRASEHQLTRRARAQQQAALAGFEPVIDRLKPGSWMEFVRNNGTRVNCRLLWASPARGRFIFVSPSTQVLFTLSDEALAQALHANRANAIASHAVIGRALDAALQELGVP
jgi:hypothetical protein